MKPTKFKPMNRFEFGDHVTAHGKPEKGVVTETEFWGNALRYFIRFESGGADWHTADELEALAHPDTARLDFLIEKGGVKFFENKAADWQACAPFCCCDLADPEWSGCGNSPREAIDAAIKPSE